MTGIPRDEDGYHDRGPDLSHCDPRSPNAGSRSARVKLEYNVHQASANLVLYRCAYTEYRTYSFHPHPQ